MQNADTEKKAAELLKILNDRKSRYIACENNLMLFSIYYFGHYHHHSIPPFHYALYSDLQFENGARGVIWKIFRESAKTTLAKIKVIHTICYKYKRFIVWTSIDKAKAAQNTYDIALELQTNKKIISDFGQLFYESKAYETEKKSTKKAISEFITVNEIKVLANSIGTSARGLVWGAFRPDFQIFDDVENIETASSETQTKSVIEHIDEAIAGAAGYSNFLILANNITDTGSIAYFTAKFKKSNKWKIRDIGVIDNKTQQPVWDKYVLTDDEADKINLTITDEKKKKISLQTKKLELGDLVYRREMLNITMTADEQEFKENWLQWIELSEVKKKATYKIATIDTAYSQNKNSCRTGICINYYERATDNWYLEAFARKIDSAELVDYIFQLHDNGIDEIRIEETAFQAAIQPLFRRECERRGKYPNCKGISHKGRDKIIRIRGLIVPYSNRKVWHITGLCSDLESEMRIFRGQKKTMRDVLDATAYQLDVIREITPQAYQKPITATQQQRRNLDFSNLHF